MKKILVIYNPVSGQKINFYVPKIIKQVLEKNKFQYTWFETIPAKKQPLKQFIKKHFDCIIVIGGDGTVKEVASFMIENKIKTPLAIIPQGTGNILAHSLGIPIVNVYQSIIFALKKDPQPIDVMHINKKSYALIAAGQGYDSLFIKGATRRLKNHFGFFAYVFSFLKTFFNYKAHKYTIVIDNKRHHLIGKLVIVFNVLSLIGLPLGRHISPNDGKLDLIIFNPRSIFDVIKIAFLYPFRGYKSSTPKMQYFSGRNISINQKEGVHIQLDGEVVKSKNLQIKIKPKALNIIYNKKFD